MANWRRTAAQTSGFTIVRLTPAAAPGAADMARKLLKSTVMNGTGHLPVSESAARRVRSSKAKRKQRPKGKGATAHGREKEMAAVGSLTRTKALLLAALRVWELKHRIRE